MNTTAKTMSRDDLLSNVDSDYARYYLLKISDLDVGAADFARLADFCHAAFYSVHAATMAWLAASMLQQDINPPLSLLKILNRLRVMRGLPQHPIPQGSLLEAFQALLPLLEILDERAGSDLRIRRVLQMLDFHDCGMLPAGKWEDRTAHRAGFSLVRDVLHDILFTTTGVEGIAAAHERPVPRYDPKIIQPQHWPHLRRRLGKYLKVDIKQLMTSIDLELARGFNVQTSSAPGPIVKKTKILFLAADSAEDGSTRLRLDKEDRTIQSEIQANTYRDQISFSSWWDAHPEDLSQQLLLQTPRIVHFGMHGGFGRIALTSDKPQELIVSADAILQLFRVFTGNVDVVLLNVCCSRQLAEALVEHVAGAIGMDGEISDEGAVAFSRGFYRGVSAGKSLREAFDLGVTEINLQHPADKDLPQLFCRAGVDPAKLLLVEVETTPNP